MKILISGKNLTKKDVIEIGKFLVNFCHNRDDLVELRLLEGTQDLSFEECSRLLEQMFAGLPYSKIVIKKD